MNYVDVLLQYWAIAVAFAVGAAYVATHRTTALAYARRKAITLMLAVEKRAEELVLTTGVEKFAWVVDKGYDMLPAAVRLFVSKPLFKTVVQGLFDAAVSFAESHVAKPVATAATVNTTDSTTTA